MHHMKYYAPASVLQIKKSQIVNSQIPKKKKKKVRSDYPQIIVDNALMN